MHEHAELRRTLYEWAEALGTSASLVAAIAHLRRWRPDRTLTRDEFEEAAELLAQGRS